MAAMAKMVAAWISRRNKPKASKIAGAIIRAADLSAGMFHGGGRSIDIYRRIMIGIEPMPSRYADLSKNPE